MFCIPIPCNRHATTIGHRSPWSNEYDPPLDDGTTPTPKLRKLEITANEAFDTYREMYVVWTLNFIVIMVLTVYAIGTSKEAYHLYIYGI
jgi:hypothetical protein